MVQVAGTFLSGLTSVLLAVLYYKMYRSQQRQTDLQALPYIPKLTIEETQDDDLSYFTLRNTGEVPFTAKISLALEAVTNLDSNAAMLDPQADYAEIPEEHRVSKGGAGDWEDTHLFLNPGEERRWPLSMFHHELGPREQSYPEDVWCILRVEAELESTLDPVDSQEIHRLFRISLGEYPALTPIAFSEFSKQVSA